MKIVIRAGGSGMRLWPLSRIRQPKQFLSLLGNRSLFEEKLREVRPLVAGWDDVYVSVSAPFIPLVRRIAPRMHPDHILAEPVGKNTGPAIALESAVIQAAAKGKEDPVIASLTVDDVFLQHGKFRRALHAAEHFLHHYPQWIVALAATPSQQDPGLSYLKLGRTIATYNRQPFARCEQWTEKPDRAHLMVLLRHPRVFAHTGQYVWKASTILAHVERYQPELFRTIRRIQRSYGTRRFSPTLRRLYPTVPSMSIEEAVAKHVRNIAIAAADFRWSDTGKWYLVKQLLGSGKHNVTRGNVVSVDGDNSIIFAPKGKIIGTIGLRGMIVVDAGDALLVCPQDRSDDVKVLLERLRERGFDSIL
ncbi:MAG: sugar phosphate nucleotidyltransferase [bacterium]